MARGSRHATRVARGSRHATRVAGRPCRPDCHPRLGQSERRAELVSVRASGMGTARSGTRLEA
jgi:hypothetical protein